MKAVSVLGVALVLTAALPARGQEKAPSYEAVTKEMLAAVQQMTGVLMQVRDSDSAREARPKLRVAVEHFLTVRKQSEGLRQPDQKERDRVARAYERKFAEAINSFREQRSRVGTVPGGRDTLRELAPLERPKDNAPPKK
jgi:hypothetical protein